MHNDIRGLPVTAACRCRRGLRPCDRCLPLLPRPDIMPRMEALFVNDPACGMAHVLKGSLMMLASKIQAVPIARTAAAAATRLLGHGLWPRAGASSGADRIGLMAIRTRHPPFGKTF